MEFGIPATLINAAAVLAGGAVGLFFAGRIPEKISTNCVRAIGLCVCVIGISGALKGDFMLLVASLALGAVIGEAINIEDALNSLGALLQKKLNRENTSFAEGFVTATLLFCVGAMSIVGSIESGLTGDRSIIVTKSILDGVSAMILASTFGFGVLFSAVVILLYQGSIEFFAGSVQAFLTEALITQVSAAGSVMILAIGLNMVFKSGIRTANLLPGLIVAVGCYFLFLHPAAPV